MNKKKLIIGVVALLAIGGGAFLLTGKSSGSKLRLDMAKVSRSTITNSVTATGTVEPVTEVEVGTQVSGIIDKLYADYNDVVKAGQLIAEMDKITLQSEYASASAAYNGAKAEYEYQKKNYDRSRMLHEKKLISDVDYEQALYTYDKAKSTFDSNKATLAKAERNLSYATITSPIDGVIINRAVEEGQTVAAGFETPTLFTIAADLTQMQVVADVDEADIGNVQLGQRVSFTVDAYPNDVFDGEVKQIRLGDDTSSSSSSTSSSTATVVTYEVVISAQNPDLKLKPRLTANVTIYTLERSNVLTVPNKSLRFIPEHSLLEPMGLTAENSEMNAPLGKKVVWLKEGNKLEPKIISVGTSNNTLTEVTEGLSEGDEIVVDVNTDTHVAASQETTERSPFMPGPPGSNKSKSKK